MALVLLHQIQVVLTLKGTSKYQRCQKIRGQKPLKSIPPYHIGQSWKLAWNCHKFSVRSPLDWYQSWITQDWPPLIIGSASRFGKECHLLLSNEHSKNSQHFRSQMSTHFKNVGYFSGFLSVLFFEKWINNAFLFSIFDSFKVPIPFL